MCVERDSSAKQQDGADVEIVLVIIAETLRKFA